MQRQHAQLAVDSLHTSEAGLRLFSFLYAFSSSHCQSHCNSNVGSFLDNASAHFGQLGSDTNSPGKLDTPVSISNTPPSLFCQQILRTRIAFWS